MPIQYITSPEKDFSSGIDARSAENQIDPGFVRDLLNADIVEKRARKRKGYQGFAGNVPVRVTEVEYNDAENMVCFTLDSAVSLDASVNLESIRSSPIVVYGRSSTFSPGDGPFDNAGDNLAYYPGFHVPLRKQFIAPSGTLTVDGSEHGLGTTNMYVGIVESTSLSDRSYTDVLTDSVEINETSFDIDIDYTTYVDRNVFVYYSDKSTGGGNDYTQAIVHSGSPATQSFTITAATHNLNNFNITTQLQQDTGTERIETIPDSLIVQPNGDVVVTITNSTGGSLDYYLILSAAPLSNISSGNVGADSTSTVVISSPEKPWIFYGIYMEQTPGGNLEAVIPDSTVFDDTTNEVTITFTNSDSVPHNFVVYYEYGDIRSNQLCVDDTSVTVNGTDDRPQLTIWGLDHTEIYGSTKSDREGWVTHIDSYRRSAEQRLVSGLGGNLFSAQEYDEAATTYGYPKLYPNLSTRIDSDIVVGPLFWDTGDTPGRTRGYITADDGADHQCAVSDVFYDSGNGWTRYTLELPSKAILDSSGSPTSLASVISTTSGLEDYLTVDQMSYRRHEGTFRIRQVLDGIDSIQIWVENEDNSSDYDDSGTGGIAGVYTDQIVWSTSSPYIPDDILVSTALDDSLICSVVSSDGDTSVVDGWVDALGLAAGVLFLGRRTSNTVPLRSAHPSSSPSVTNLVRGDMLSYTGIGRLTRVLSINPDVDRTVDISVLSGTATVTLGSGDTSYLSMGDSLILLEAGVYTGVVEISDIPSDTTFEFETSETASVTGATLLGATVEIDEALEWEDTAGDTTAYTVEERWIPIEAPDDSFNLTPSTYVRHLDSGSYSNQSPLRSTMLSDNMYLTNYSDEVMKFDGSNIYRAGIIPWQPGLFTTQETTGATIVTNLRSVAYSAIVAAEGRLTVTAATQQSIPVASAVRLSGSTQTYTIRDFSDDGTNFYILVDRALDGTVSASGTVGEIGTYRYYYRLNSVDANSNIIASAVTGYQDHVVELTGNAAIRHKLVGLPVWDNYDYDRLELQIYRTKLNQAAPFYRVTTQAMDFDNTQGYIIYRDSFSDSDLTDLDEVNTALKGAELGTGWTDPLRSKYITSIGNRPVYANVRDYSQLDIQIVGSAALANADFAGDSLLFRKSNTDAGTTTDMPDRVRYEWISTFSGTPSSITVGVDQFTVVGITQPVVAGDWIYLTYATVATTGRDLTLSGWWQIASVAGAGPYDATINYVGVTAPSSSPNRYVVATDPTDVPVLLGVDGNLGMVNGDSFDTFDTMRRLAMALNASMRMVDTSISGMEDFQPWIVSRSGNDTPPAGRIIVRQPRSDDTTIEVVPTFSGYDLFINDIKRTTLDQVSASSRVYPSRILLPYENYGEILDNPTSVLDVDSDSAIDVNPADGQEITGVIPFFGETAFGAAQQGSILVAFKTNSIYLIDINQKATGSNPVQRIETEGLGCTAPYSISSSKRGIMFANESGIYCLRRDQSIQYLGRYMERNWTERVDLTRLDLAQGHHYGVGRLYKLSIPLAESVTDTGYQENTEAYIYNHTAEDEGKTGAWSRYDNHPATGWANLAQDAYFASSTGRVFSIRTQGDITDYRDDSSAINMQLDTRANDFGNSGIRKVIDKVVVHHRAPSRSTGTTLSYATDLEQEFTDTTTFVVPKPGSSGTTGLSDGVASDVVTISHSLGRRRCVYLQVRIANSNIDESEEIAGIDFKVGGLMDKGILQAASTR